MYQYIKGIITEIHDTYIVLENNGIGFIINSSLYTMGQLSINEEYKIYTEYFNRDNGVYLYGFSSHSEKSLFNLLTTVTSIGPKNALQILSSLTPSEVKSAIYHEDIEMLTSAQGVGKKTAFRIILELKDKIEYTESVISKDDIPTNTEIEFAKEALLTLGYMRNDVENILEKYQDSDLQIEDLIKEAMKQLDN